MHAALIGGCCTQDGLHTDVARIQRRRGDDAPTLAAQVLEQGEAIGRVHSRNLSFLTSRHVATDRQGLGCDLQGIVAFYLKAYASFAPMYPMCLLAQAYVAVAGRLMDAVVV